MNLAYGQTGSGKTFTMNGIIDDMIGDLFADVEVYVSANPQNQLG